MYHYYGYIICILLLFALLQKQVKPLVAESMSEGEYVQKSVKLAPMNGRQRWLMYQFVGSSSPDIKLYNLQGPAYARPMEVRERTHASRTQPLFIFKSEAIL